MFKVGVDVGGTFTDLLLLNEASGKIKVVKVPSNVQDPSIGVIDALLKSEVKMSEISNLIHASTVGINTVIQRVGAKVGLITTSGFSDVLELMREVKKSDNQEIYDYDWDKPKHIVSRDLRIGVQERINHKGEIIKALDIDDAIKAVKYLKNMGVEAIAICFLFSFINPVHEIKMKEIVNQVYPEVVVSTSHEVLPEIREYERTSTVTVDAYLKPIMKKYYEKMSNSLKSIGYDKNISIFKSNGGITSIDIAHKSPVTTLQAGPAGGVMGMKYLIDIIKRQNVIGLDMGGTSADISLIHDYNITWTNEWEIEWGLPVRVPFIDIVSIGAGGGTIAWFDLGGTLKVGPQSAGSNPGPACYGLGGEEPTVTDANLVLGKLDPSYFLGGDMILDKELALKTIKDKIGKHIKGGIDYLATGIINVVNANMVQSIYAITIEKGLDPREFSLIAFGGAGPMHACNIAKELNIPEVIIPRYPGLGSAFGLTVADIRIDEINSYPCYFDDLEMEKLNKFFTSLEDKAINHLRNENYCKDFILTRTVDMRYIGQNFEISVPLPNGKLKDSDRKIILRNFANEYRKKFGQFRNEPIEIITLRVNVMGPSKMVGLSSIQSGDSQGALIDHREVIFSGKKISCPIFKGDLLQAGTSIEGPAIIEKMDSTVIVELKQKCIVDIFGNLLIQIY